MILTLVNLELYSSSLHAGPTAPEVAREGREREMAALRLVRSERGKFHLFANELTTPELGRDGQNRGRKRN